MYVKPEMMGRIVTVSSIAIRTYAQTKVCVFYKDITPRAGWIVGERTMHLGDIIGASYDDPGYLNVRSTATHIQVVFWPRMNPVLVPATGFTDGGIPESPSRLEWDRFEQRNPQGAVKLRKELSGFAKDMDRDAKGRFCNDPELVVEKLS